MRTSGSPHASCACPPHKRLSAILSCFSHPRRPIFLQFRYENLWFSSRIVRVLEPLVVAAVCAWLSYGAYDEAVKHATEAAIFGALLGGSSALAAALLGVGLAFGGPWRELPAGYNWKLLQARPVHCPIV